MEDNKIRETGRTAGDGADDYTVKKSRKTDIFARILSIFFALIIWFYVMSIDSPEHEQKYTDMPITISQNSNNLYVYSGQNTTVDITLIGKRSEIKKINIEDIIVYVDISHIDTAGKHTLETNLVLPDGVSVTGKTSSTVSLYLDTRATVTVPVDVKLVDFMIADEYEIGDIVKSIDEVTVSGPESVLKTIERAQATFSLGTVTSTMNLNGTLSLIDTGGAVVNNSYVKPQVSEVSVTVPVLMSKPVTLTLNYKYNYYNSTNSEISINPQTVRIKGEVGTVSAINSISLTTLDEKKVLGDSTMTYQIPYPTGVAAADGVTSAEIQVKHVGTDTAQFVITNIRVNNPNNLKYTLNSSSINIVLRGKAQHLSEIVPDDIEAVVNLGYLNNVTGTVSASVTFNIARKFSPYIYEIGDYTMSVKIMNKE